MSKQSFEKRELITDYSSLIHQTTFKSEITNGNFKFSEARQNRSSESN
jgi:hypothetical protein